MTAFDNERARATSNHFKKKNYGKNEEEAAG
jgi:hypothetical protein